MERLSEQQLRNALRWKIKDRPDLDDTALRYLQAVHVLRYYLGGEWCDQCLKPNAINVSRRSRAGRLFLRTDSLTSDQGELSVDGLRHQERIESLAELVHNLHDVQGMAGRRAKILEGDLEPTYADLVFARHFVSKGIRIQFRGETGVRSRDYDFDAGECEDPICCEVKCKLETTDLSATTIANAIDTARKQMPSGRAALIGMRIPESWVSNPSIRAVFDTVLDSCFRSTNRVVVVLVQWELTRPMPGEGVAVPYLFREYLNERSPLLHSDQVRSVVQRLTSTQFTSVTSGIWTAFASIVEAELATAGR